MLTTHAAVAGVPFNDLDTHTGTLSKMQQKMERLEGTVGGIKQQKGPVGDTGKRGARGDRGEPMRFTDLTEANKTEPQRKLLQHVALLLRQHPKLRLSVEGHADARGEPQLNMQLASARAQAVCTALHAFGVAPPRLVSHCFGATLPIADNATTEGRQRNRRVCFLVMPEVGAYDSRGATTAG